MKIGVILKLMTKRYIKNPPHSSLTLNAYKGIVKTIMFRGHFEIFMLLLIIQMAIRYNMIDLCLVFQPIKLKRFT